VFGKRSDQPRTAEDRARAAAERAARRAGRPLPPEAFEYTVRPPDVEPHEPLRHEEPPPAEAQAPAPEPVRDEVAREEPPAAAPRDEAAAKPPRDEVAVEPPAAAPRDEVAVEPPREEEPAAPREEAPVTPRDDEPADARDEATPPAEPREAATPRDDVVHQPTAEYTPFQTEEHAVPEAPLGEPRDDEPRLVAARGLPRDKDGAHAFAAAGRPDTAEHESLFETGEHRAPEETEARTPVPLRRAPDRPAAAVPRRRPAPNAPRGRPRAPKGPRPRGGAHWGRRIFTLIVMLVILAALYAFNKTFQPFHGDGSGTVAVDIPANSDVGEIGEILAAKGVVDSARYFELNATISGDRGDLRPGHYTLKKGMTNGAAIDALTKVPGDPTPVETVDVTLVEGPSRKENAPVVDDSDKVEGSYAKATSSKAVLRRIRELGAPKGTKSAEGFLFPATYKLKVGSSAAELVDQQLDSFEENFKKVDMQYAKSKKLTRYDVLTIASMIEREAQLARERSLVSAVIYNRLNQGVPLGIDATIRYATNNWQRPIRQSELDKPGPYNSRLNRSLPPSPIGNPGLASIKAAAKPANKKYLFYVRKPGKSGEHAFSSTDAQFERDVRRYQDSRGGK